jgi:cytosine/adenosine deaminase-related metal-dependent hydrolase
MVRWLGKVMARRKALVDSGQDIAQVKKDATLRGVREAWSSATRLVVDNVTAPWSEDWLEQASSGFFADRRTEFIDALVCGPPILIRPCVELVDVNEARGKQTWNYALELMSRNADGRSQGVCQAPLGLAPHAPYTASKRLVRGALETTRHPGGLLSMHLAESLEELQWIEHREGPMKDWIEPWIDTEHAMEIGTVDEHLRLLSGSHRALIAHGNYLSDHQIKWLESYRDRMAVVYCPRTHEHFRHARHPAKRLAASKIPLFLGTDSRASNPDLSVFEEWKAACRRFPELGPEYWMAACTWRPSEFFGLKSSVGTLRVGSRSLLTWVPLGPASAVTQEDLWDAILRAERAIPLEMVSS